jgi:hypothetical protein
MVFVVFAVADSAGVKWLLFERTAAEKELCFFGVAPVAKLTLPQHALAISRRNREDFMSRTRLAASRPEGIVREGHVHHHELEIGA